MSSATRSDGSEVGRGIRSGEIGASEGGAGTNQFLSGRQSALDFLWRHYRCENYDGRKFDWNGHEARSKLEHDELTQGGVIPPGYYDAGQDAPLSFRKPTAPYYLPKVIVDRFTAMLFSAKRHPRLTSPDPVTEDWLTGFAEATRLWAKMIQSRRFGGAMGSVALSFKFVEGRPIVEVFDPRWCDISYSDRDAGRVDMCEVRYQYSAEVRQEDGTWETAHYWYRRILTLTLDTVWPKVEVGREEPNWDKERHIETEHGMGVCPVYWIQNLPVLDSVDGDPDCQGVMDTTEAIDALTSQAILGTVRNCLGVKTPFVTDKGVRTFADFAPGDAVTVLTHTGVWREATVHSYGVQELFDVTLQRGGRGAPVTLQATRNHRWMLTDGSVTDHVEVGDRLLAAPAVFAEFDPENATPEELAWWCRGFIWGDGSRVKVGGCEVRLCGAKVQHAAKFVQAGFTVTYPARFQGDAQVRSCTVTKALPDDTTPLNLLRAFVRGYVDADGSKGHKGSSRWFRIQVTGAASIDFVQRVFPAVGLYITAEAEVTGATNYGPRTARTVRFGLNENASHHPNSEWRVVAITASPALETVWCLDVPEDHTFALPCGVLTSNCDPTLHLSSDAEWQSIQKGSNHALQTEKGGSAVYLEISGVGIDKALMLASKLEERVLTVTSCVLDRNEGGPARSVEELDHKYSAMIDQADILREQYGELGIKRMMADVLKVAKMMDSPRQVTDDAGRSKIVRDVVILPKRVIINEEDGTRKYEDRKLGSGDIVEVVWPEYFTVGTEELAKRVDASAKAKQGGLVDSAHATRFIAREFGVENVPEMLAKISAEQKESAEAAMAGFGGGEEAPEDGAEAPEDAEAQEELDDVSTEAPAPKKVKRGV